MVVVSTYDDRTCTGVDGVQIRSDLSSWREFGCYVRGFFIHILLYKSFSGLAYLCKSHMLRFLNNIYGYV